MQPKKYFKTLSISFSLLLLLFAYNNCGAPFDAISRNSLRQSVIDSSGGDNLGEENLGDTMVENNELNPPAMEETEKMPEKEMDKEEPKVVDKRSDEEKSLAIFEKTLYPTVKKACAKCHGEIKKVSGGYKFVLARNRISFKKPGNSYLSKKIKKGHRGVNKKVGDEITINVSKWADGLEAEGISLD